MSDGTEPINDGETLYRRIPVKQNWFDPLVSSSPSPKSFLPNRGDTTGISLTRAKYESAEAAAATGRKGSDYWIAVLIATDIKDALSVSAADVVIVPDPDPGSLGHAVVPSMHYAV